MKRTLSVRQLRQIIREAVKSTVNDGSIKLMENIDDNAVLRLELDFADPPDTPEEERALINGLLTGYTIKAREISESGPSGWPVWELIGNKSQLRKYLDEEYCEGDEDDVEFFLSSATPV